MEHSLPQDNLEPMLKAMEREIEQLRVKYEQYFVGAERLPPLELRRSVERNMRVLEQTQIQRTELKFRVRTLVQRLNTYRNYWNRIERQIEEGTYRRDVLKARRNQQGQFQKQGKERASEQEDASVQVYEVDADAGTNKALEDIRRLLEMEQASEPARDIRPAIVSKPLDSAPEPAKPEPARPIARTVQRVMTPAPASASSPTPSAPRATPVRRIIRRNNDSTNHSQS